MRRLCVVLAVIFLLAGCEDEVVGTRLDPSAAVVMPSPWPSAAVAAPSAPPRILAFWTNETTIAPGTDWRGRIATTTNVASLEIRTESFSFNATRIGFGQFVFLQHVLDIVPQYKRAYTLTIIARNTAGVEDVRLLPIALH
ncbi:MAG TPA: hypothetical protein VMF11_15260 [Candidatus Baltobacteraceae bacterium]|nr:hypothetical protein [Candidatus Baltobacteraceae bacterium]